MNIEQLAAGLNLTADQKAKLARNLELVDSLRLQTLTDSAARAEQGSVMTRAGLNLLAKAIAGKQLTYTKVVIGDSTLNGSLVELTDSELVERTALVHPLQTLPLVGIEFKGNGTAVVQALLSNSSFEDGLFVREMGLFAKDPDTDREILYSYRNTGAYSSHVPSGNGSFIMQLVLDLVTVVDNAQNVSAIIDASLLFVSQAQLIDHINSENPHPNIAFPTYDEPIQQLDNRIAQVENNVSNLFTQLGAPDANLIVLEDFKALDSVDTLKVKVLSAASSSDTVEVESLDGISEGIYYTLSDGNHNRFFRAKALISNAGSYKVVFDGNVNYSFNIAKTYLYRSTALIEDGRASGSSTQLESIFAPDTVWQGVSSSTAKTISLSTTQKNAANFEVSGGAFDDNGFFTIA